MPGGSRSLPVRSSLRFLKLEAKRRLAAGEFATLHDAQAAIAREHGLPSWAGLKQACALRPEPESHALDQLRWVISRFSVADAPGWTAPDSGELREHFDDRFLAVLPAGALVEGASKMAADLRGELVVISAAPLEAVTGLPYDRAATRLVLDPLGMRDSRFPASPADIGPGAVTGYTVTADGIFEPFPPQVSTVPAIAGLWSTGADLVRLGTGWAALLRRRVGDGRTHVVLTSRMITIESIDNRLLRSVTNPTTHG